MAQNNYIRPLTRDYRDFTQRKLQQTDEEIPYKFKYREPQIYVKKPKKVIVERPLIQPVIEPPKQKTCCEKYCGCLSSCWQSVNAKDKKIGHCCLGCRCFEPQICQSCVNKICRQCLQKMCLKFRLCNVCIHALCSRCRKNVYDVSCNSCCSTQPKLRNYPIRMKNKGNLHFMDCKCVDCVQVVPQQNIKIDHILQNAVDIKPNIAPNMNPNINPNVGQMINEESKVSGRFNPNQMYHNVQSQVHYQNH